MSILIKGMDMPTSCVECRFCDNDAMCAVLGEDLFDYVPAEARYLPDDWKCDDCPLAPVPTPHGRLIDADALSEYHRTKAYETTGGYGFHITAKAWVDNAPTIIEAEGEKE